MDLMDRSGSQLHHRHHHQQLHHHVHQEMASHQTLESMLVCPPKPPHQAGEKKPRPQPEAALKCPRCDSTNTKFCYYNNYSLSQPRYFCKACRRYWTKGGTLRNVPVGGGCRKNKRPSSASSLSKPKGPDHHHALSANANPVIPTTLPTFSYDHHNNLPLLGTNTANNPNQYNNLNPAFINTPDYLDGLKSGFFEAPVSDFQGFYYGMEDHGYNMGAHVVNPNQEMEAAVVKQEVRDLGENRVIWGLPWQADHGVNNNNLGVEHVDSAGRDSWVNGFGSSWHGLLNSPLM